MESCAADRTGKRRPSGTGGPCSPRAPPTPCPSASQDLLHSRTVRERQSCEGGPTGLAKRAGVRVRDGLCVSEGEAGSRGGVVTDQRRADGAGQRAGACARRVFARSG